MTTAYIFIWVFIVAGLFGLSVVLAFLVAWLMGDDIYYDYPHNPVRDEWLAKLDKD